MYSNIYKNKSMCTVLPTILIVFIEMMFGLELYH